MRVDATLVIIAIVVLRIYLGIFNKPYVVLLFGLLLASGYVLFALEKRWEYQNKHLDYRALAEGLRVQIFWSIAGLQDNVADYYLRKHSGAFEWVKFVFRTFIGIEPDRDYSSLDSASKVERLRFVKKSWVINQQKYYTDRKNENKKWISRLRPAANAFFWTAIFVVVVLFFLDLIIPTSGKVSPGLINCQRIMKVIIAVEFVLGGAVKWYLEKRVFSEQEKQYERMMHLYNRAALRLHQFISDPNTLDLESADRLLRELGQEALAENGDWVLMHRSQPLTVPK